MRQYYIIRNNVNNQHSLTDDPNNHPDKSIVTPIVLNENQAFALIQLFKEFNQMHFSLSIVAEMRHFQKTYFKLKKSGSPKEKLNIPLASAIELEKSLDTQIFRYERDFGKLFKNPDELELF